MRLFLLIIGAVFAALVLPVSDARGQIAPGEDAPSIIAFAEQGKVDSQYKLGKAYFYGIGIPLDKTKAVKWINRAADQGHTQSEILMGTFYSLGDGVVPDLTETIKWYRRAAVKGNSLAQFSLGASYQEANDIPNNKVISYAWFAISLAQGNETAKVWKDAFENSLSPEEIIIAQKMALQCLASAYKDCG